MLHWNYYSVPGYPYFFEMEMMKNDYIMKYYKSYNIPEEFRYAVTLEAHTSIYARLKSFIMNRI